LIYIIFPEYFRDPAKTGALTALGNIDPGKVLLKPFLDLKIIRIFCQIGPFEGIPAVVIQLFFSVAVPDIPVLPVPEAVAPVSVG
jgi:hypothetical protein